MMAIHNFHCVVVIGLTHDHDDDPLVWGLISDMDLTEMCITPSPGRSAATLARRSILTVEKSTPIREAAALMVTEHESHLLEAQHRLADRLVLAKVRGVFGERLQLALVGAATVAPRAARVLRRLRSARCSRATGSQRPARPRRSTPHGRYASAPSASRLPGTERVDRSPTARS